MKNKTAPMDINASAKLKTKNEMFPICKYKKSVTTPSGNLSKIFPNAPEMININIIRYINDSCSLYNA